MEFRLLGPVEVLTRGTAIRLGSSQHRFVIAILALEANRTVPLDRLVELCWPELPPRTSIHAIQVAVSRLRSALDLAGAATYQVGLRTRAGGYALELDPMRVDAHRFRSLLQQARDARRDEQRITLLHEALRLWRGPALAGTGPVASAAQLSHGLEEARLVALEDQADARLRLGQHRDVLDELTGLVAAHRSRERPVGQLMLALYRSGCAAAALEVFARARQHLAGEIGIEPGIELRELQMAILRHDPRLAAPVLTGFGGVAFPPQLGSAVRPSASG